MIYLEVMAALWQCSCDDRLTTFIKFRNCPWSWWMDLIYPTMTFIVVFAQIGQLFNSDLYFFLLWNITISDVQCLVIFQTMYDLEAEAKVTREVIYVIPNRSPLLQEGLEIVLSSFGGIGKCLKTLYYLKNKIDIVNWQYWWNRW